MRVQSCSVEPSQFRGFTLIELLVVIAIFTILTGTLLLVRPSSDNQVQLRGVAQEVALFIREAQAFGSGVRNPGVGTFRAHYGIHVDSTDRDQLVLFTLAEGYGYQYSAAPSGQKAAIDVFELPNGFTISDFCVGDGTSDRCAGAGAGAGGPACDAIPSVGVSSAPLREMDITFIRPSLDAYIFAHRPGPCQRGDRASIELSYKGNSIQIEVTESGVVQVVTP